MKTNQLLVLLLFISLSSCSKTWHVSSQKVTYHRFDDRARISDDPETETLIAPYREEMSHDMDAIIARSDMELTKRLPESTMGNWFADILEIEASKLYGEKVDCAFQNYGGLRIQSLPKGEITVGNIFEMMPFENMLLVLEVDGKILQQLADKIASRGGWPVSKGISFEIKDTVAQNIMIGGKPLDVNSKYNIALPDYIANGGDDCDFLKDQKRTDFGILLRDVVLNYLRSTHRDGYIIHAELEGRIKKSRTE